MTSKRPRGRPKFPDVLTPAEWRIVEAVRHGMSNPQIAKLRGISLDAVKYHVANAVQKLGIKNKKELRLWDGIAKSSALKTKDQRMHAYSSDGKLGPIGQISRHVVDINAAKKWYTDVLGLKELFSFGNLAFFDCGGVRLFLNQIEGDLPPDCIIYFMVEDIHQVQADLEKRGVTFISAPHMIHKHDDGTEEWMAFFNDPDARPLAIMSQEKTAR